MRCPSCNKFASQTIDGNEPEMDLDIDEDSGQITGSVRIVVTSECCGDELKEATLDVDEVFPGTEEDLKGHSGEGHSLSVDDLSVESVDEYQTKDRRGKPINNPRYQKHLYGAEINGQITCECGGLQVEFNWRDTIQASGMDELC